MARLLSKEMFDLIDKDKSGNIDYNELRRSLQSCGRVASDEDLRKTLFDAGLDPDNLSMNFESFSTLFEPKRIFSVSQIRSMFRAIDLDSSNYLSPAELRHVMTNMNLVSDDKVVDEMICMHDLDGSGRIEFKEFIKIIEGMGFELYHDEDKDPSEKPPNKTTSQEKKEEDFIGSPKYKIDEFPQPLQDLMKKFDYEGNGFIAAHEIERAAELLRLEKMSGLENPESNPSLHWTHGRDKRGLADVVYKANHIALTVSDVGKSAAFYSDVMGFQQIRRPDFDRHGAWFTMGNVELHLIKGKPIVHSGDDLIVSHISIETFNIDKVPDMLRKLNVPFRLNVSVPKGTDYTGAGTNSSNNNPNIVRQYFIRDPDGYYIEICNCDILTKFCLGDDIDLQNYEEGAPPMSHMDAGKLIGIMHKWQTDGHEDNKERDDLAEKVKATDGSSKAIAEMLGCVPAATLNKAIFDNFKTRMSVYDDICQNETEDSLKEILLLAGNDAPAATQIMKLKASMAGKRKVQPPAFYKDGHVFHKPSQQNMSAE